jgi:hypothetical protein
VAVNLTPRAQELLQQLVHTGSPQQVVEEALERLVSERGATEKPMTSHEAVDRIRKLRKGSVDGGRFTEAPLARQSLETGITMASFGGLVTLPGL